MKWFEDLILAFLQRRCSHPDRMVAVDILEGSADGIEVSYCNRCGAVKVNFAHPVGVLSFPAEQSRLAVAAGRWRGPDPNLWRG